MEPMLMLKVSAALFGVSAAGGLTMAYIRLGRNTNPPVALAMLHGMLAAAGLTLLAYATFAVGVPMLAEYALGLFVVAALGGATMNLRYHWRKEPLPAGLLIVHALLAVAGFALLLIVVFGSAATA